VIAEGDLAQVLVEDPDGNVVASQPAVPDRQTQVALEPTTTGEHTVRLVGEPGAAWVLDASHSQAGTEPIELPNASSPIEQALTDASEEGPNGVPSVGLAAIGFLASLVAIARRRR